MHIAMIVMVYFNRVCDVTPRPSYNPSGCRDIEEREYQVFAFARPSSFGGDPRLCGIYVPYIPLD